MNIDPEVLKRIRFETSTIPVPLVFGSAQLHTAYAVLPDHLNVRSVNDLRVASLNKYIKSLYNWEVENIDNWATNPGRLLIDSFILSEKAKKFIIARQAYLADQKHVLYLSFIVFLLCHVFFLCIDIYLQGHGRKSGPLPRLAFISLAALFSYSNYKLLMYMLEQQRTKVANARTISNGHFDSKDYNEAKRRGKELPIDDEYFEGALQYYAKEVQRNQALRYLGKMTDKWFDRSYGRFSEDGDFKAHLFDLSESPSRAIKELVSWKRSYDSLQFK